MEEILRILNEGNPSQVRALFAFDKDTDPQLILKKYRIWSRWYFPKFFKSPDAPFHINMDKGNLDVYLHGRQFLDIAFRGAAKTARTKLFVAFVIANDTSHYRKFFKVLSEDLDNAKQAVTDVYNFLVKKRVQAIYPEIFQKTDAKRQESMSVFTTSTGVKMEADSINTSQRGDQQGEEASRPDFIWFDDFETRTTLRSAVTTHKIWQNMDEAYTGLEKDGGAIYNCNYLSERGNVHKLVKRVKNKIIIPIEKDGKPTWSRFTKADLKVIKHDAEDYEGDYLCKPSASKDAYFERRSLDKQTAEEPVDEIGGLKIFHKYDPTHAYASGHDVAAGVGLDSSTTVIIDFSTVPARVVATYASNEIVPEAFGKAVYDHTKMYGKCLAAIENNKYDQAVLSAKIAGAKLYKTQGKITKIGYTPPVSYGWNTNTLTKNQMLSSLKKAIKDGLLDLSDGDLIDELKAYTRNDLIDHEPDVRLTTNHFDLLIGCAIAWMRLPDAKVKEKENTKDSIWNKPETNPAI